MDNYTDRLKTAIDFREVWEIVKDSVKSVLRQYRVGMMLFLDDLPLRLGAYHPVGTNNIVLNRILLEIVQGASKNRVDVNAFIYILLLHEYIHALGHLRESEVRSLVFTVSKECFGLNHIVTRLASAGPWSILRDIPLYTPQGPKRTLEVVKDFDSSTREYIV
ncbi:MAG: hypothetical protein JSV20_03130 [Candidatus Bathyarchaeota archaeon]|nr:MAG: hypothetical protein JSV20_03130 [Candidatus Bathyarchaeota archaeon]